MLKVKDLLGEGYSLPVETNEVIKAMYKKVVKDLFISNNFDNGYSMITSNGTPYGTTVNDVFFLKQEEQRQMFDTVDNNIFSSTGNNPKNIQASAKFSEYEIKRAVSNDEDLQDIYDKIVDNLRRSIELDRRKYFKEVLKTYLNETNVKVNEEVNLFLQGSKVFQGFRVPSTTYSPLGKETQCYASDIIAITTSEVLGYAMNKHDTSFTDWLLNNSIIEDTLPANIKGVAKNPKLILLDGRSLKILINDFQFSYFYDVNKLTYTINYTENINIITSNVLNICAFNGTIVET